MYMCVYIRAFCTQAGWGRIEQGDAYIVKCEKGKAKGEGAAKPAAKDKKGEKGGGGDCGVVGIVWEDTRAEVDTNMHMNMHMNLHMI